jgi:hypothetical protein
VSLIQTNKVVATQNKKQVKSDVLIPNVEEKISSSVLKKSAVTFFHEGTLKEYRLLDRCEKIGGRGGGGLYHTQM